MRTRRIKLQRDLAWGRQKPERQRVQVLRNAQVNDVLSIHHWSSSCFLCSCLHVSVDEVDCWSCLELLLRAARRRLEHHFEKIVVVVGKKFVCGGSFRERLVMRDDEADVDLARLDLAQQILPIFLDGDLTASHRETLHERKRRNNSTTQHRREGQNLKHKKRYRSMSPQPTAKANK